jgi:hypothetical protein
LIKENEFVDDENKNTKLNSDNEGSKFIKNNNSYNLYRIKRREKR